MLLESCQRSHHSTTVESQYPNSTDAVHDIKLSRWGTLGFFVLIKSIQSKAIEAIWGNPLDTSIFRKKKMKRECVYQISGFFRF